jgi:hypothetical protein
MDSFPFMVRFLLPCNGHEPIAGFIIRNSGLKIEFSDSGDAQIKPKREGNIRFKGKKAKRRW